MKIRCIPLLLLLIFITACSSGNDIEETIPDEVTATPLYFPPSQSPEWETLSANELGWNTANESSLQSFLEENGTKAFIILKDGKIVAEWYFDDHTQNTSWYWASAGKTLTSFTVGIAQEQGFLNLEDKTSAYLGTGWTATEAEQEDLITIRHQLTMTSGLDDGQGDCKTPDCLTYLADAGTRWAYHNGPYTLLDEVVANATETEWTAYFNENLRDKIGMDGFWFSRNDVNNVYFSTARSMARFGLLNLNDGIWNGETILGDTDYLDQMANSSQNLNRSYGYLWWLNGKESYRLPQTQLQFNGPLVPNAPRDMYSGLGRDDQKLYIVPSENLVIVRMGESAEESLLALSSFDNALWERLNAFMD